MIRPLLRPSNWNLFHPSREVALHHSFIAEFPCMTCRTISSHNWLERQRKDLYVKKAKYVSYRARSAFKLLEIDNRYHIFQPGQVVIDIGASPGSWSQVAVERVQARTPDEISTPGLDPQLDRVGFEHNSELGNLETKSPSKNNSDAKSGLVIGIDLLHIDPLPGAIFLSDSDFTSLKTQQNIMDLLQGKEVDVVLSDMAPNSSGIRGVDHDVIVDLCRKAIEFSRGVLKEHGVFLCKIWAGGEQGNLVNYLKRFFKSVRHVKPPASRSDSSEVYILAMGYRKETAVEK